MKSNPETIRGKLEIVRDRLRFLEEREHDLSEQRDRLAVEHSLQESIEACLDVANHIISAEGLGRPEDYADYFPRLARHNVIPRPLADKLSEMAKFRNVLVHLYDEVDTDTVADVLENDLGDIRAFAEQIYAYLDAGE
jgi:uncharacterized protein YutE (UPF0331/DUF86 family)